MRGEIHNRGDDGDGPSSGSVHLIPMKPINYEWNDPRDRKNATESRGVFRRDRPYDKDIRRGVKKTLRKGKVLVTNFDFRV